MACVNKTGEMMSALVISGDTFDGRLGWGANLLRFLTLAIFLLMDLVPAHAHHGASMFDMKQLLTVKGTVTSFEWENPHAMIYADVKDDKGNVQKWSIEIRGGPNALTRAGWNKDALKPGDQVTLIGHPAKNGTNSMRLAKVVLVGGQELDPHPFFF
jgi:hypothetical protein